MLKDIKQDLTRCRGDDPGCRFRQLYESRSNSKRSLFSRLFFAGVGAFMFLVGIPMIPGPGPGLVVMLLGLGLLGSEYRPLACFLDRMEVRIRSGVGRLSRWFARIPPSALVVASLFIVAMAIGAGVGGYNLVKDKVPQAPSLWQRN